MEDTTLKNKNTKTKPKKIEILEHVFHNTYTVDEMLEKLVRSELKKDGYLK